MRNGGLQLLAKLQLFLKNLNIIRHEHVIPFEKAMTFSLNYSARSYDTASPHAGDPE